MSLARTTAIAAVSAFLAAGAAAIASSGDRSAAAPFTSAQWQSGAVTATTVTNGNAASLGFAIVGDRAADPKERAAFEKHEACLRKAGVDLPKPDANPPTDLVVEPDEADVATLEKAIRECSPALGPMLGRSFTIAPRGAGAPVVNLVVGGDAPSRADRVKLKKAFATHTACLEDHEVAPPTPSKAGGAVAIEAPSVDEIAAFERAAEACRPALESALGTVFPNAAPARPIPAPTP